MSVFQEGELEADYWRHHGPKNEAAFTMGKRYWKNFSNKLQMKRMTYMSSDLSCFLFGGEDVHFTEMSIPLVCCQRGTDVAVNISCGFWSDSPSLSCNKMCILYCHTNTRSLADAVELIPLCEGKTWGHVIYSCIVLYELEYAKCFVLCDYMQNA